MVVLTASRGRQKFHSADSKQEILFKSTISSKKSIRECNKQVSTIS